MKRYLQYEPFNVYEFEATAWEHPVHKHNYCEIIFIRTGSGKHFINQNQFQYVSGDIFLLGPEDYHYFEIDSLTKFCYIRFMETLFVDKPSNGAANWQPAFEFLLNARYQCCGSIVKDDCEKNLLNNLLNVLLQEYYRRDPATYEILVDSLMRAILTILARNIIKEAVVQPEDQKAYTTIERILSYIRQHIYQPEKLRIENMASNFHYSTKYLSIYFKKQTGEPLQLYILKYKLKLVEYRLLYSEKSISQISYEFAFTDESHLYKLFKKYYGINPAEMRNKQRDRGRLSEV